MLNRTTEPVTSTLDFSAVGVAVATFFGWLPQVAALLSVIWLVLRIYETWVSIQKIKKGD